MGLNILRFPNRGKELAVPSASLLDGRVVPVAPVSPGPVVVACPLVAEEFEDEGAVRRTDAALSMGEHLLLRSDPLGGEKTAHLLRWLEHVRLRIDHLDPLHVAGAGDMAGPLVVAWVLTRVLGP